uniref:Protein kinase domain-containing protein n=1 Tax=Oryza punctata TaxID=4537 RepID=A0A0E0M077_ORYPU
MGLLVPDGAYVNADENRKVTKVYQSDWTGPRYRTLYTLRSFPSDEGDRSCYSLPTNRGAKYIVRLEFLYGNYDGLDSPLLKFNLTLGVNNWDTVILDTNDDNYGYQVYGAVFVAWVNWAPVCVVNTGQGTPFVSTVELRPLDSLPYPAFMGNQSLSLFEWRSMRWSADDDIIRYPDDQHDRYWYAWELTENDHASNISTLLTLQPSAPFAVPSRVLQTAFMPAGNSMELVLNSKRLDTLLRDHLVILHFFDFQNNKSREFTVSIGSGDQSDPISPPYLKGLSVTKWTRDSKGFSVTLTAMAASPLPPILNAYEVYIDAIMAIKYEYGIRKNWMGDPCFPPNFAWDGLGCSNDGDGRTMRIISIDLSNSELHGLISNNFTLLTALKNLSCNQLSGTIPDSLRRNNGSIVFSYESDGDMCKPKISSPSKNRAATLAVSVVAPVLVVAILVVAYLIWRVKRKPHSPTSTDDSPMVPEQIGPPGHWTNHWDHLQKPENRRFTYEELAKFTDSFKRLIGHGGFGNVYYGCLEDSTEVAVKIRSESSSHGLDEFLAEVQSLTKVNHRNLVSLIGYCWEKDHLALVYEYMCSGNLCDYLRDFGLSKTYHSDSQTHISATAAGSMGYIDPEYELLCTLPILCCISYILVILYNFILNQLAQSLWLSMWAIFRYYITGRLTESSDVYSFGVVTSGEPPIIPGNGHIIQRVMQKMVTANISSVADARLGGSYNVNSMWKVLDAAMMCTADIAAQRPMMSAVVMQLKESLELE